LDEYRLVEAKPVMIPKTPKVHDQEPKSHSAKTHSNRKFVVGNSESKKCVLQDQTKNVTNLPSDQPRPVYSGSNYEARSYQRNNRAYPNLETKNNTDFRQNQDYKSQTFLNNFSTFNQDEKNQN
jgi:hypothetical protein